MSRKSVLLFLPAIISVAIASSIVPGKEYNNYFDSYNVREANKSNNLIVGSRDYGDRMTLQEYVYKSSSILQIVTLEKNFELPANERITQVLALDQKTNGNGAFPSVTGGGPGHNNIKFRFKSQRGHSIKFFVQIFSKKY